MPVYMIRQDDDDLVKIGWSQNVAKRIPQVQRKRDATVTVVRLLYGPRWIEPWLHKQFANLRQFGEWFVFEPEMLTIEPPVTRPASQTARRNGQAFWFPDSEGDLLRAVAAAEDRPIQRVMSRALHAYAATSPEYQAWLSESEPAIE